MPSGWWTIVICGPHFICLARVVLRLGQRERERDQREKVGIVFIRMWYFPGSVVVAASFSTYDRLGRSRLTWNSPQVIGGYTRTRTPTKEVDYPLFRNNLPRFASLPDYLTLLT